MPRGRKKGVPVAPVPVVVEEPRVQERARKPYPSNDERIEAADRQIAKLEKLNASRKALIEKTELLLADRKDALSKSQNALEKATAKRERLFAAKNKPAKVPTERATKAADKKQYDELLAALKAKGKSLDDLLAAL